MTNTDTLAGISCPNTKCNSQGPFNISIQTNALISDNGVENFSDIIKWDPSSSISCPKCSTFGTVAVFTEPHFIRRSRYMEIQNELMGDKKRQKRASHDYWMQFVTPELIDLVRDKFGEKRLRTAFAKDENLNSISLKHWDDLVLANGSRTTENQQFTINKALPIDWIKMRIAGETKSAASLTCIVKAAARQLIMESNNT